MSRLRLKRFGPGPNRRRIYLIAPRHPESFWSMQGTVDLFGAKTLVPNAALATLMALTPADADVEYALCDENVSTVDWDLPCDLAAVTGGTLHARRIEELCQGFRARGTRVALGGTYASIEADRCGGLADHHFEGEAEYTWPEFLRDWSAGTARPVYRQPVFVDLADSPAPDWSLIEPADYLNFSVQTSRGCPNRCDFCDVIQYSGRLYRTKSVAQVLAEVRSAHALGARTIFFSDDNFLGNPSFTRTLLGELILWNVAQASPLSFSTQITVQVADDDELLRLFADARFSVLFLGVESVRHDSLAEVHKTQNLDRDIGERIRRISRHGIVPFLGLVVGFDHDDASVFDELERFVDETSSPVAGISLLNAPRHTPLHERLAREGRLASGDFSGEWQMATNIVPKQMTREELLRRYWALFQRIYEPRGFERRLGRWLEGVTFLSSRHPGPKADLRRILGLRRMLTHFLLHPDPEVRALFVRSLRNCWRIDRRLLRSTFTLLAQYRHFYDFVHRPLPGAGEHP
jgi:radical SAM superfamily enzyme YgiQ (UPF0313 family)